MTFEEIKGILKHKSVGIAGAGGLGSNCAVALARVGVGRIVIADFDVIEASNLNRQYYFYDQIGLSKAQSIKHNIGRINPDVVVEAHEVRLNEEDILRLFGNCDVIVEAFDLADQKQMIIETVLEHFKDIPLIVGLGMAGWGHSNALKVRQEGSLYVCGDEQLEVSEDLPPLAPRVGIVAHMQANVVLDLLLANNKS